VRPILPITIVSLLAASSLVGCAAAGPAEPGSSSSTDPSTSAAGCEVVPAGESSDAVTVSGAAGEAITVSFDGPLTPETTERTTVAAGTGEPAVEGMLINFYYSIYNGDTGELLESSRDFSEEPLPYILSAEGTVEGLTKALTCSQAGERIVAVIPAAEAFGEEGSPALGLEAGQSFVFVADVESVEEVELPEPEPLPTPSAWTENLPEVTLGEQPVVTLPDTAPPAELELAVLVEGDGEVVQPGANVTVNYLGTSWDTKEIFDQSYGRGEATFSTNGVISGFAAAIVGQKVGSTVLVTIPPQYAYGTEAVEGTLGGQTLVFLIEIIAAS